MLRVVTSFENIQKFIYYNVPHKHKPSYAQPPKEEDLLSKQA
jgi:hypothetical protein